MIQETVDPLELRLSSRMHPIAGAVFRFADRRYVANLNEPIVDEAGNAVEELKGWQLTYATDRLAVIGKGVAQAILRLPDSP